VRAEVTQNDPKIQQKLNLAFFSKLNATPKSKEEQENIKVLCNTFIEFPFCHHHFIENE
jgi:hypothetical protein